MEHTRSEMRIWSLDPGLNIPHWAVAALVISKELIGILSSDV